MNKIFKKVLLVVALLGLCSTNVKAQGEFDWYYLTKTIPFLITNISSGAPLTITNFYADIGSGKFYGSGYLDVYVSTNAGAATLAITPQTSPDTTNWSSLSNYAVSFQAQTFYTNIFYSGSTNGALLATNNDVYPFTPTTPNAAVAGYATQYKLPQPYTNSGVFTPSYGSNGIGGMTRIGIQNFGDLPRYFRLSIATVSNSFVGASLNGRRRD